MTESNGWKIPVIPAVTNTISNIPTVDNSPAVDTYLADGGVRKGVSGSEGPEPSFTEGR